EAMPEGAPPSDWCCACAFLIDPGGAIVPESGVLAAHAWAAGHLGRDRRLSAWARAEAAWLTGFAERHDDRALADLHTLTAENEATRRHLGWDPPRGDPPLALARRVEFRRRATRDEDFDYRPDVDLVGSFVLGDLDRVRRAVERPKTLPAGLRRYLAGAPA